MKFTLALALLSTITAVRLNQVKPDGKPAGPPPKKGPGGPPPKDGPGGPPRPDGPPSDEDEDRGSDDHEDDGPENPEQAGEFYKACDADKNNDLSLEELAACGAPVDDKHFKGVFKCLQGEDGKLSQKEFAGAWADDNACVMAAYQEHQDHDSADEEEEDHSDHDHDLAQQVIDGSDGADVIDAADVCTTGVDCADVIPADDEWQNYQPTAEDQAKMIFGQFDQNQDGYLTLKEIKKGVMNITNGEIQDIKNDRQQILFEVKEEFKAADAAGEKDGKLTFGELKNAIEAGNVDTGRQGGDDDFEDFEDHSDHGDEVEV